MSLQVEILEPPAFPSAATIVTLSRPAAGNALGEAMVDALFTALERPATALVVFRGEGPNFCTGFDLSNVESQSDGDLLLRFARVESLLQRVAALPVVTLALGQGRTLGAGADLFAACDHRLCLPGATFAFPGAAFGLVLGNRRLAARIGRERARDLLMSGRTVPAEEAMQTGLATAIVEQRKVEAAIAEAARVASRLDAATLRAMRAATLAEEPDRDMAALVRSAMRPGLGKRISDYTASRRTPGGSLSPAP